MCDSCGCQTGHHHDSEQDRKIVEINRSLLAANQETAEKNQEHLDALGAVGINLISSPGAGKTTLLEKTIELLDGKYSLGVIEGDIETERDADRIRAKGVPAVQLTTGGACHLDAALVHKGLHQIQHQLSHETADQGRVDFIFIENVGNLVCPATFYLGEHKRVVMVSVPEGSDKPSKYPKAFVGSDLFIITKIDLLPYFDFSIDEAKESALTLNPNIEIIALSAVSGEGMDEWIGFLDRLKG